MGRRSYWRVAGVVATTLLIVATGLLLSVVSSRAPVSGIGSSSSVVSVATLTPATLNSSFAEIGSTSGLSPSFTVGGQWCTLPYGVFSLGMLTLACQQFQNQFNQLSGATEQGYSADIVLSLYNYLNQTASTAAIMNATVQELVSYYADRAEAVVPYFLNQTWSNVVYDKIATYSGLVEALQGMKSAIAEQEYQDWNATLNSYQGLFGPGEIYAGSGYDLMAANTLDTPSTGNLLIPYNQPRSSWGVTQPWEIWSGAPYAPSGGIGSPTIYFSIEPGGTVIDANINNATGTWWANWTVTDLATGQTVPVPTISYANWQNETLSSIPVMTKQYPFGTFDLMKATCNSGCATAASPYIETSGAYAFENGSTGSKPDTTYVNAMVPHIFVGFSGTITVGTNPDVPARTMYGFPSTQLGICIIYSGTLIAGSCNRPTNGTGVAPSEGFASQISGGPGQVVGGNDTLTQFGASFQRVLNNTMTLAHAYYDVLRAATQNGTYALPADCSVPFPSYAFPSATSPSLYQLSLGNTIVAYMGYLESVAKFYGTTFSNTFDFCGDANLGLTFNWTSTWTLHTNVTASVYLGAPSGAVYLNGTKDNASVLATPSTWPVRNVDPTLIYPYEFQMNVPVGQVYPLPANDPVAGLFINYTHNPFYGSSGLKPSWGIPTYTTLYGYGNLVEISGNLSKTVSGGSNATGDALYISSCIVAGVAQTTCPLSVDYFDNFTFGAIHAFVPISCISAGTCGTFGGGGGTLGALGTTCGFQFLNQWYDGWVGYVGSTVASGFGFLATAVASTPIIGTPVAEFINGIGCIVGWLVVFALFLAILWLLFKLVEFAFGPLRGSGGGGRSGGRSTVNIRLIGDRDGDGWD